VPLIGQRIIELLVSVLKRSLLCSKMILSQSSACACSNWFTISFVAPNEKMAELLKKTVKEAQDMISKVAQQDLGCFDKLS
jgi:hypothetical protein